MPDAPPPNTPNIPARPWTLRGLGLRLLIAVAAGLLLHGGGWVYTGMWWSVWPGQTLLLLLALICAPRGAFFFGSITGGVLIGVGFFWAVAELQDQFKGQTALAILIFSCLVLFEAIGFGLFCSAVSVAARRGPWALWIAPCVWTAVEFLHPRIFPWMMGYSQLEIIPLLQIAELTGPTGIGFVMTAVAAGIAALVRGWLGPDEPAWRTGVGRFAISTIALLTATMLFGVVRQQQWSAWAASRAPYKIALLQVNISKSGAQAKLRDLSRAQDASVDLICWPECSLGNYSEELTHFRDIKQTGQLSRWSRNRMEPAKGLKQPLLGAGKLYRPGAEEDGPYSVAALLIDPAEQQIVGRYKKRTLLPFGEYIPGQSFYPPMRKWVAKQLLDAGDDPRPLETAKGAKLGVMLCYEDILPASARTTVAEGAELLITLSNGAVFQGPLPIQQHQRLSVLRSVENRRYFVRCASTGETCVIAPTGEVVQSLPLSKDGFLIADIHLMRGRTCFNLIGDLFPWSCTLIAAAWFWRNRRRDVAKQAMKPVKKYRPGSRNA